jgi:hypothetical protein
LPAVALGGQLLFQLSNFVGLLSLTVFHRIELTGSPLPPVGGLACALAPPEIPGSEADQVATTVAMIVSLIGRPFRLALESRGPSVCSLS